MATICSTMAQAFGLDAHAAQVLRQTEVEVEIRHLRPNRPLLELLDRATRSGLPVNALSDTYLGQADLKRILDSVARRHSIAEVYTSADLGLTKHAGGVFAAVAERENVVADRILHVGDSHQVDVVMVASWKALHLRRGAVGRSRRRSGRCWRCRSNPEHPVRRQPVSSESFGREVLGPIFAEFCVRMWSIGALLDEPAELALLFCARGGLRMLAYETLLRASGLAGSLRPEPLMVSRVVAIRPALLRTLTERLDTVVPSAAATIAYELPRASLAEVARTMSGVAPYPDPDGMPGSVRTASPSCCTIATGLPSPRRWPSRPTCSGGICAPSSMVTVGQCS